MTQHSVALTCSYRHTHTFTSCLQGFGNTCILSGGQNVSSQISTAVSAVQKNTLTEGDKCASNNSRQAE